MQGANNRPMHSQAMSVSEMGKVLSDGQVRLYDISGELPAEAMVHNVDPLEKFPKSAEFPTTDERVDIYALTPGQ